MDSHLNLIIVELLSEFLGIRQVHSAILLSHKSYNYDSNNRETEVEGFVRYKLLTVPYFTF